MHGFEKVFRGVCVHNISESMAKVHCHDMNFIGTTYLSTYSSKLHIYARSRREIDVT